MSGTVQRHARRRHPSVATEPDVWDYIGCAAGAAAYRWFGVVGLNLFVYPADVGLELPWSVLMGDGQESAWSIISAALTPCGRARLVEMTGAVGAGDGRRLLCGGVTVPVDSWLIHLALLRLPEGGVRVGLAPLVGGLHAFVIEAMHEGRRHLAAVMQLAPGDDHLLPKLDVDAAIEGGA